MRALRKLSCRNWRQSLKSQQTTWLYNAYDCKLPENSCKCKGTDSLHCSLPLSPRSYHVLNDYVDVIASIGNYRGHYSAIVLFSPHATKMHLLTFHGSVGAQVVCSWSVWQGDARRRLASIRP